MSIRLLAVVAGYLALVGCLAAAAAVGVRCGPAVRTGLVVAQILLVVQAVVDTFTLVRGHRPADLPTHIGYLVTSVALLPLLTARAANRAAPEEPAPRSQYAVVALACAVTGVVVIRLHVTWAGRL